MNTSIRLSTLSILLLMQILAGGCFKHQAPEIRYYALTPLGQTGDGTPVANRPELRIGVGPVTIPDSLKRSQIATRSQGNLFTFDEYNRWAGSLDKDIAAVIGNNLGLLLGAGSLDFYPWRPPFSPSHRVAVDFQRLDGELGREVVLEARWRVVETVNSTIVEERISSLHHPLTGGGYDELVAAESILIGKLCREIAEKIAVLPVEQPKRKK